MIKNCNTQNPLLRDGTSQQQRLLKALLPSYVSVDERSMEDLMSFASKFGEEINYFDATNSISGDWKAFFTNQLIDTTNQSTAPHYALFIAFLQIFKIAQDDLNTITQRHLDFYYKEVLNLKERDGIPDQVFVIFNLAQQVATHLVEKDTELDAKKDETGVDLIYATENDIVVNTAQVNDLKALFYNKNADKRLYESPVANSADGKGADIEGSEKMWRTFGASSDPSQPFNSPLIDRTQARAGFAFASPILQLAEGTRTITFKLTVNNVGSLTTQDVANAFKVTFSGEEEWISPVNERGSASISGSSIVIQRIIDITQPAILPYDKEKLKDPFNTVLPVARIVLNTEDNSSPYVYEKLKELVIMSVDITVDVSGVKNLILQNDSSALDASKPFQPFGSRPVISSAFYIGNGEVFGKTLTNIDIDITWQGLPTDTNGFQDYYHNYLPAAENARRKNELFKTNISILQDRGWKTVVPSYLDQARLFDSQVSYVAMEIPKLVLPFLYSEIKPISQDVTAARRATNNVSDGAVRIADTDVGMGLVNFNGGAGDFILVGQADGRTERATQTFISYSGLLNKRRISISGGELTSVPRDPSLDGSVLEGLNNSTQRGFLKLELADIDFGHKDFQNSFTSQALRAAKADIGNLNTYPLPNEPYTPVISEISLNYSSTVTIELTNTPGINSLIGFNNRVDKFFHVEPFGVAEYHPYIIKNTPAITLMPVYNDEGSLYIGLSDLKPSQVVSVLFKVAEGTSDPDLLAQTVNWSYMVNNEWVKFEPLKIVSDTTQHFLTSGIVVFDVSKNATSDNTLFPAGLHWLKASVTDNSAAVCNMIDIRSQAVSALFIDNGNDINHLASGLAPDTISALVNSDAAIAKVEQPYASFGGRVPEQSDAFYVRISERLRHKHRAVNLWDYEHLVLEKFSTIYKVKCLNHAAVISSANIREVAPGNVSLITVSNVRNKNSASPLKPKTSLLLLNEIEEYIKNISSPAITLHVKNPFYEEILVKFKVRFLPGFDSGFYSQKLNEDIKKFLAPWAYTGSDVSFGGAIHRSVIINFVEEQAYVDFVTCFKMNHIAGDTTLLDVEEAMATTSASIITSAASHDITVLETDDCDCEDDNIASAPFGPVDDDCGCEQAANGPKPYGIGVFIVGDNFIVDDGTFFPEGGIGNWTVGSDVIE